MTDEAIKAAARAICEMRDGDDIFWDDFTEYARAAAPALMEEGARLERERVVAWLRGEVATDYTDPQFDIGQNLARAIEAGDHLPAAIVKGAGRE